MVVLLFTPESSPILRYPGKHTPEASACRFRATYTANTAGEYSRESSERSSISSKRRMVNTAPPHHRKVLELTQKLWGLPGELEDKGALEEFL